MIVVENVRMAAQVLPQYSIWALVCLDSLAYRFRADLSVIAYLLRTPLFFKTILGKLPDCFIDPPRVNGLPSRERQERLNQRPLSFI